MDAGVEINTHRHVTGVGRRRAIAWHSSRINTNGISPLPEYGFGIVRDFLWRLVSSKHFEYHAACCPCPLTFGFNDHPRSGFAYAGRGQYPFTLDFHHAGPTVAVRSVPGVCGVAKMRDFVIKPVAYLPNRIVRASFNFLSIQLKFDLHRILTSKIVLKETQHR